MQKSVAIVTGASQGIGRSTAIRLARDFAELVLVARDRANLESTAEAVKAAGAKALVIECDLSKPVAAKDVVDQALTAFGRVDALLNIAGAVPQIDLFEMTDAQWEAGLALKLHASDHRRLAGAETGQRRSGPDVGQFGSLSESALRSGWYDQRRHCRAR
jgi:3-oxoacyl-[acyl-carrier protein] reductase